MAYRSLLLILALISSSAAVASTVSPVSAGGTTKTFTTFDMITLDSTCGASRPGEALGGASPFRPGIGFSGASDIVEGRANYEFRRADVGPNAKLSLTFDLELDVGTEPEVCVYGYRADGVVSTSDFQLEDAIFLGEVLLSPYGNIGLPVDVSDVLGLGGDFFGLQLAIDGFQDVTGRVWEFHLSVDEASAVPEPAALGLVGVGFAMVAARRRRS